ncbi:MAG: hypothetical protein ACRYFS_26075 [Janthinobacterium lividum]
MDQFVPGNMPDPNFTVWPPPPVGQPHAALPLAVCPFKWVYRRAPGKLGVKSCIADMREGVLQFDSEGVIIQGKAVLRAEIRALILVPCYLAGLLIGAIVNAVLDSACRQDQFIGVRWENVRQVLLAPKKQQACLIYDAPNYAGKIKTFSLAFAPTPGYYEVLVEEVSRHSPIPVTEDRLRNATTPVAWAILAALLLFVTGLVIFAVSSPNH